MVGVEDSTPLDAEGRYVAADKVRFYRGAAQKIGGWVKKVAGQVAGIPRNGHVWADLSGQINIAVGTHRRVEILQGGTWHNITPYRLTAALAADPIATISGSRTVTVTHPDHGAIKGDTCDLSVLTETGDLDVNGRFIVDSVVDAASWTFEHSDPAASLDAGGGSAGMASYEINTGREKQTFGFGWGTGRWGKGTWGTPRPQGDDPMAVEGIELKLRTWSIDNWGEDLLFLHNDGGKLYHWDATNGVATRAQLVAEAPTGEHMAVSPEDRHVIIFGADGDDLAIQWCNQENFYDWVPRATSTAGRRRLLHGSKFVANIRARGSVFAWTDTSLYEIAYTGGTFTFDIRRRGKSDICGPMACVEVNDVIYWLGPTGFHMYDGRTLDLDCSIQQTIFADFNYTQSVKVVAALNEQWNSIRFHYCSFEKNRNKEINRYADYNFMEKTWVPGVSDNGRHHVHNPISNEYDKRIKGGMQCLVWIDRGLFSNPISLDGDGYIYDHEVGEDADGEAMDAWIESGDFDLGDGDEVMLSSGYIPDFVLTGSVLVTQKARIYPMGYQIVKEPDEIDEKKNFVKSRIRGRQVALRFSSPHDRTGVKWRVGTPRFDVQPDGKR